MKKLANTICKLQMWPWRMMQIMSAKWDLPAIIGRSGKPRICMFCFRPNPLRLSVIRPVAEWIFEKTRKWNWLAKSPMLNPKQISSGSAKIVNLSQVNSSLKKFEKYSDFFVLFSDSVEVSEEDGDDEGRKTVISTIKFRPTSRDNSATYACEAQHPALHSSTMRVSVVLSVMCKSQL